MSDTIQVHPSRVIDITPEAQEYDPIQEEPEVDIIIRTRRSPDGTRARWEMRGLLEHQEGVPLSESQQHYVAAVLRHASTCVDVSWHNKKPRQAVVDEVRTRLRLARIAYDNAVDGVQTLVWDLGILGTASALGFKAYKIEHLMKVALTKRKALHKGDDKAVA